MTNLPSGFPLFFEKMMESNPPTDPTLSHYRDQFENSGIENGSRVWYARDLMKQLGYESFELFHKAINKATQACISLNINIIENFQQTPREIDGKQVQDYKLSRFACYLVAMNADTRHKEVAFMQAYFIGLAETMRQYIEDAEAVDRVIVRDEITERIKEQQHVASIAGVTDYGLFQNAGYRGMYNMNLRSLLLRKNIPKGRTIYDFMGSTELAANLFRVTQTSERIRQESAQGQHRLEQIAELVGKKVRSTMKEISGVTPELLPTSQDIKQVKKGLKGTQRQFKKMDIKKLKPPKKD